MNSNAADRDCRHLDPLTGTSVVLLLLGCLLVAERSLLSLGGWCAVTAAVCLYILAMIRQSQRHATDPEVSRNSLRQAFSYRQSVPQYPDLTAHLIQLNDLRIMGALTDDEFAAAKTILLIVETPS